MRPRYVCTPIANMPKSTAVDRRARALCVELARVTDSRLMQWRMAQIIAQAVGLDEATADVAIVYAVERDWLIAEGNPPHASRRYQPSAFLEAFGCRGVNSHASDFRPS